MGVQTGLCRSRGEAILTTTPLDWLTYHCRILEAGNDSYRYKTQPLTEKGRRKAAEHPKHEP